MKLKTIAIISSAMIGSCFSYYIKDVDIIVVDNVVENKNISNIEQLAIENINSIIKDSILSQDEIDLLFYNEKILSYKIRKKIVVLLNNKSLYAGKSPVLNKSDTNNKFKLYNYCLFHNNERPRIRSPGNII